MRDETRETDPEQVQRDLRRSHLPALIEKGYVERDPETRTIRRGPNFAEIAPVVDEQFEDETGLSDD